MSTTRSTANAGTRLRAFVRVRARDEDGVSLVEVLIAILVLGVAVTALASTSVFSLRSATLSEARQNAYTAATESIEQIRSYPWEQIRHPMAAEDTFTGYDDPNVSEAFFEGEEMVRATAPGGGWRLDGAPHQIDDQDYHVRTYVTRVAGSDNERRITVLVEFTRAGHTETVRQTTTISRALWGRSQPAFSVYPVAIGLTLQPERPSGSTVTNCVDQEVINLGDNEPDQYRIDTPVNTPPGLLSRTFHVVALDDPDDVTAFTPGHYTTTSYGFEEGFILRTCYTPGPAAIDIEETSFVLRSKVADELDGGDPELAYQTLFHSLTLESEQTWWLALGESPPPHRLSSTQPTEEDPDGTPAELNPGNELRWQRNLASHAGSGRAVQQVEVRFWLTTPARFDGSLDPFDIVVDGVVVGTEEPSVDIDVEIELQRNGTTVSSTTRTHTFTHDSPSDDWITVTIGPETPGGGYVDFHPTDELALVIRCQSSSDADCTIGFGSLDFDAFLRLLFDNP